MRTYFFYCAKERGKEKAREREHSLQLTLQAVFEFFTSCFGFCFLFGTGTGQQLTKVIIVACVFPAIFQLKQRALAD